MAQQLIVGFIVAAAAFYAVWRWMPAGWRRGAAQKLAAGTHRAGWVDEERARELAASLAKTSGCGSCDSCGSCAPKTPLKPTEADKAASPTSSALSSTHSR
ncbi:MULTISPECIES: DUF6587 family protein [Variovorax]|jgi:hypothetical protein|uniref:DUF6587 family protein n=1 Tax=Variovorax TaxID=34072 RepID=UPI000869C7AB|nr:MULTISPECIES: DUF6587 family protein [Variovorax]MBN8756414.1 hypothetical protein [Variovorax sp.]ODU14436.1 MAG: hypothetical protein ABS94_23010 [Variovorax sp. SCN 67-85]ODV18801.1 MAG: hypothetical protein ABT25_27505 [Variovorax sp. SCN 67-20]OJZ02319.1 MAG: hypothetical protein BGP22_15300 [Variovorax sp. 67-131]UKI10277.1 hypothetical protein L3V85_10645 [Variovorax paradoxus]